MRWEGLTDRSRLSPIRQLQQLATQTRDEIRMNGGEDIRAPTDRGAAVAYSRELDVFRFLEDGASTEHVATACPSPTRRWAVT
jgi:hypothetical protein